MVRRPKLSRPDGLWRFAPPTQDQRREAVMQYNRLGRTDLQVSAIGLGVMTFGAQTAEDDAFRQLDMALAAGVTLFDTAENYPAPVSAETHGRSEEILG